MPWQLATGSLWKMGNLMPAKMEDDGIMMEDDRMIMEQ
jgi:hypothetical protein